MNRIMTKSFTPQKQIIVNDGTAFSVAVKVVPLGVTDTYDDGRKYLKAGTVLGSVADPLIASTTVAEVLTDGKGEQAPAVSRGLLVNDIVFPYGATDTDTVNGTMVISGVVDINKIAKALPTGAAAALPHIIFIDGGILE